MVEYDVGRLTRSHVERVYTGAIATLVRGLLPGVPTIQQIELGLLEGHGEEASWMALQSHQQGVRRWVYRQVAAARAALAGEPHTCPACGREHHPTEEEGGPPDR